MDEIDNSMLAELEQESRLMRARNARLEAEVTVLTEMVRVLSDKLAEMEAKQEQCKYPNCDYPCMNLPDCQQQGEPVPEQEPLEHKITVSCRACGYSESFNMKINPPTPQQRTWIGLTDEDDIDWEEGGNLKDLVKAIEAKLKEKNT